MEIRAQYILHCAALLVLRIRTTSGTEDTTQKPNRIDVYFEMLIPENYDINEPRVSKNTVNVTLEFLSVPLVRFSTMDIEVEFFFLATWHDDGLNNNQTIKELGRIHNYIPVPTKYIPRLWVPWILFPECKNCQIGMATGDVQRPMVFEPLNGNIIMYFRDSMKFTCQYDLSFYPFDAHECHVALELLTGLGFPSGKINDVYMPFVPRPRDFMVSKGMPSEFFFDSLSITHACSERSFGATPEDGTCLKYGIKFHRIAHYYLMLIYTPTLTIVLISWISFWIPSDIVAPRVTLGLTSLLTLTTQFSNAQKDLPPVAYVKALDVWMITCVMMVFGSLMEFALSYTGKLQKRPVVNEQKWFTAVNNAHEVKFPPLAKNPMAPQVAQKKEANPLDIKARIIFPIIFALFNIVYWPYYGRTG